jgi:hypothetical protein
MNGITSSTIAPFPAGATFNTIARAPTQSQPCAGA